MPPNLMVVVEPDEIVQGLKAAWCMEIKMGFTSVGSCILNLKVLISQEVLRLVN